MLRWTAFGVGTGAIVCQTLQRLDASSDSKRAYRAAKSRYLDALAKSVSSSAALQSTSQPSVSEMSWFDTAPEATVHVNETIFDDEPNRNEEPQTPDTVSAVGADIVDPKVAFESAMADGAWAEAFEAYRLGREEAAGFDPTAADLERLRKASMEEIFRRMHSGTVREDVAYLAQSVAETFPESTEGRTLAQVLGVLRRSAGLCPRCAKPYKGIAAACHACLRGTPEEHQIAWDDESPRDDVP
jgi:hypothetical protein